MSIYSNYPTGSYILYGGRTESPRKGFKFKKYPSWGTIAKSKTDPNLIYVFEPFNGKEFWGDKPYTLAFQRANGSWVRYDWNDKVNSFETISFEGDKKELDIKTSKIDKIKIGAIKQNTFAELESELDGIVDLSGDLTDKINTDEILNFSPDSLKWWIKDILHEGQPDLNILNELTTVKQDIIDASDILNQINDQILGSLEHLGFKGVDENGKISIDDYVPVDSNSTNMREDIQALNSKWDSIDSAGMQTIINKLENYQSPVESGNTLGDDLRNIETIYQILADATSGGPIGDRLDNITLNYEEITQNVGLNVDQSFTSIPDIGDGTLGSISETLSYLSTNLVNKNDEKLVYINSSGKLIKEKNTSLKYDSYYKELVYVDESGNNTFIYLQGKKTQMQLTEGGGISTITYLDEDEIPQSTQHIIKGQLTQLSFDEVNNRLVFLDESGDEKYVTIPDGIQNVTTDLSYSDAAEPVWDSFLEEWDLGDPAKLVYTNERDSAFDITIEERDNLYIYTPEDDTYWLDDLENTMEGTPVWIGEDIATHLFRLDYIPFYRNSTLNEIHGYPSNDVDAEFWFPKLPGGYSEFFQSSNGTVIQKGSYKNDYEYYSGQNLYTLTRGSWQEFILNDPAFRRVDSYGSPVKFDSFSNSRLNNSEGAHIHSNYFDLDNLLSNENPLTKYLVYIDEDKIPNAVPCGKDNLTTMYTELPQNIEELYPGIDLVDATPSDKSLHYIDERYLDSGLITKITLPYDKITSLIETGGDLLLVHEGLDSAGLASEDDWLRIHSNVKDYDENRTYNPGEMAYFDVDNQGITSLTKNSDAGISKVIRILSQSGEWKNIYGDFLDSVTSIKSQTDISPRVLYDSVGQSFVFMETGLGYSSIFKNDLEILTPYNLKSTKLDLRSNNSQIHITPEIVDAEAYEGNIKLQTNAIDSEPQYPRKEDWKEYSPTPSGEVQTIDLFYRNHFIYVDNVSNNPAENNRFVAKLEDGLYKGQEIRLWMCSENRLDSAAEYAKFKLEDGIFEYSDDYLNAAANDVNNEKVREYQHVYEVDKKYTPPVGYSANMTKNFQKSGNISVEKYRKKIKSKYKWNKEESDTNNVQGDYIGDFLGNNGTIDSPGTKVIYDEIVSVEGSGIVLDSSLENVVGSFEKGNAFLTDVNSIKPVSSQDYELKTKEIGKPLIIVKNAKHKATRVSGAPNTKYFQEFPIREDYQYIMAEPEIVKFKVTSTYSWQEEVFNNSNVGIWTGDYWWRNKKNNLLYYYQYIPQEDLGNIKYTTQWTYSKSQNRNLGNPTNFDGFTYTNRKSWKDSDGIPYIPVPDQLTSGSITYNLTFQGDIKSYEWGKPYEFQKRDQRGFLIHGWGPEVGYQRGYYQTRRGFGYPPNLLFNILDNAEDAGLTGSGLERRYFPLWNGHYVNRSSKNSFWNDIYKLDINKESVGEMPEDSYYLKKEHFIHSKQINHMTHEEAHKAISHSDIDNGYVFLDKRVSSHGLEISEQVSPSPYDVNINDTEGITHTKVKQNFKDNEYLHDDLAEVYNEDDSNFQKDSILFHLDDNDNIISISKPKFYSKTTLDIKDFKGKLRVGDSLVLHYPKKVEIKEYLKYQESETIYNFEKLNERYFQGLLGISLANFYKTTNLKPDGSEYIYLLVDAQGNPIDEYEYILDNPCYLDVETEITDSAGVAYYGPAQKFQYTKSGTPTHDGKVSQEIEHPFFGNETDEHHFTYTRLESLNEEKPFYRFPEFLDGSGGETYGFEYLSELDSSGELNKVTHTINPVATLSRPDNFDLDAWAEIHRPAYFIFNGDELLGSEKQTAEPISKSNVHWGLFEFENSGQWNIEEEKISECYYLGIPKPKYIDSSPLMYRCIWNGTHWILLDGSCDEDFGFETPADIWD